MTRFIVGFVLGVVVSTIGFTGLARVADRGVEQLKESSQEVSK
jgi:hypothetical protein